GFIVSVSNRGEAGSSSLGVHGRESPASRSFLSRGSGGGWQRQWCAWSEPALPRELLCSFRHWSGRAQHRSGVPRTRGLTLRCTRRSTAGFARFRPRVSSNVRPPYGDWYSYVMRPLRYSINVTLDGCCDHLAMF